MLTTGKVQESFADKTTYVAFPADISAYMAQARPGSFYVEFDVPFTSVAKPSQDGQELPAPIQLTQDWPSRRVCPFRRCQTLKTFNTLPQRQDEFMSQQHLLLKEWFEDNSQPLMAHGVTLGLEESSVPGSEAVCVDIDSDAAIARITVRATAQCDVEVLDVQTGGKIYSCYIERVDREGLQAVMHEVLKRMSRS